MIGPIAPKPTTAQSAKRDENRLLKLIKEGTPKSDPEFKAILGRLADDKEKDPSIKLDKSVESLLKQQKSLEDGIYKAIEERGKLGKPGAGAEMLAHTAPDPA